MNRILEKLDIQRKDDTPISTPITLNLSNCNSLVVKYCMDKSDFLSNQEKLLKELTVGDIVVVHDIFSMDTYVFTGNEFTQIESIPVEEENKDD